MSKLILSEQVEATPPPSNAFIKSKVIRKADLSPILLKKILSVVKELCVASRIRIWIKFVIYQPNFYLEIIKPDLLNIETSADFKFDLVIPRTGNIRIAASVDNINSVSFLNIVEHEFWHAALFFLHHPPIINPDPECGVTLGATSSYPFLPVTSGSFNQHWHLLSSVAQSLRLAVKQLEPFINGTLPVSTQSLPEPSRTLVETMKRTPYVMSIPEQRICPSTVQMQLSRHFKGPFILSDPLDLIKRRYFPIASIKKIGHIECVAYTSCEQSDHAICKSLDWAVFSIRRIFTYEYLYNLKLTLTFSENLNKDFLMFWNLLIKKFPQSSLAMGLIKQDVYKALKSELKISNFVLHGLSQDDGYKLVLKTAKITSDKFLQELALLHTKIEAGLRLIIEVDTILATELGDIIYHMEVYQNVSSQHQKNMNVWLGFCSNNTATIHLPHPDECLTQPARCGDPSIIQPTWQLQVLQTTLSSSITSFILQGFKHKTSEKFFNKISSIFEWSALIACAGSAFGTLAFTLIQSAKYANRRFRWFSEAKTDIAMRALPIAGLFISPTNTLAQTGISAVASLTGSIVGSKLADWTWQSH